MQGGGIEGVGKRYSPNNGLMWVWGHNIVLTSSFWLDMDDFLPKLAPFAFPFSFDPFFLPL